MDEKHLNLSEAKAKLSVLIDGVVNRRERYVIDRHGKPAAVLVSIDDFKRIAGFETPTPTQPMGALAFLGAWGDEVTDAEVDKFLEVIYASREADKGRPVNLDF